MTCVLLLALVAQAQTGGAAEPEADPSIHADAVRLVELGGARAAMQTYIELMLENAGNRMKQTCEGCDPAFGEESTKSMRSRLKVQDFVDFGVRAFERHFTDDKFWR